MTLADLSAAEFDVSSLNHAEAVLVGDFDVPLSELCEVLVDTQILDIEMIQGGGGESAPTQRLRQALTDRGWKKRKILIIKTVDGKRRAATTHEIDHVRETEMGAVALEIEWNNKDPFYDRDLENFQRLHVEGVISVGVILTRGQSLQNDLRSIVREFARVRQIRNFDDLASLGVVPTPRQRRMIEASTGEFTDEWSRVFVGDKFGMATTHWKKLQERVHRGVGNPCPLLLVGIPSRVVRKAHPP